jgi:hypothetical protein
MSNLDAGAERAQPAGDGLAEDERPAAARDRIGNEREINGHTGPNLRASYSLGNAY